MQQPQTKVARVTDTIMRKIETGALREGDRLPSEEELAASYGVSVGTIQKALTRLATTGLISREHGRGTFVSGHSVAPADVRYLRFRDAQGNDLASYVHLRGVRRIQRKGTWSEFLGDAHTVRIERTINVGGHFDLYSEFWVREDDFARLNGVNRQALENNLRELLGQKLALPTLRVDQFIRFEPLPALAARQVGLEAGAPGLVMELRGFTLRERPLYYQTVYAPPFSERLVIVREGNGTKP
jgi:DNA-binding GntR family transcriptional regulator